MGVFYTYKKGDKHYELNKSVYRAMKKFIYGKGFEPEQLSAIERALLSVAHSIYNKVKQGAIKN